MPLLEGKKALIAGIANHRSIGWAIAQAFAREGAQLAFTYQDRMEKYVKELAEKIPTTPQFSAMCKATNKLILLSHRSVNSSTANSTSSSTR